MNKVCNSGGHFTRSGSTKINPSHGLIACFACDALCMGVSMHCPEQLVMEKVTVKVRFQLGNDRLSHGAGR